MQVLNPWHQHCNMSMKPVTPVQCEYEIQGTVSVTPAPWVEYETYPQMVEHCNGSPLVEQQDKGHYDTSPAMKTKYKLKTFRRNSNRQRKKKTFKYISFILYIFILSGFHDFLLPHLIPCWWYEMGPSYSPLNLPESLPPAGPPM